MIFELTTEIVFSSKTIFGIFDTFIFVCFLINCCTFIQHMTWTAKQMRRNRVWASIVSLWTESVQWFIYRGPGFLAVVWFGSSAPPLPSPINKLSLFLSLPVCHRWAYRRDGGWGGGRSQIRQRQKSPVLYKYSLPLDCPARVFSDQAETLS
jgi:hypothetical protein